MKKLLPFIFLFYSGVLFAQGTWTQKADLLGAGTYSSVGFSIGLKGYILSGQDFLEYDQATDTWTAKANFPGTARTGAVGFSIGTKGYLGTGKDSDPYKDDFWEYDQPTDTWTQKANFGGPARAYAVGFSIGAKGYIGTGQVEGGANDFWEYEPTTDIWTQKADPVIPSVMQNRELAVGFSIGQKGYITLGSESQYGPYAYDLLEYDPANDTWINKADFPTIAGQFGRDKATGFVLGNKAYVGTGYKKCGLNCSITYNDLWEWDQATDAWTQKANLTDTSRTNAVGLSIGNRGYIGGGTNSGVLYNDFWEYCDTCISLIGIETIEQSVFTLYPNPATTTLTIQSTPDSYRDNSPQTTATIYNVQGQLVFTSIFDIQHSTFDISSFSPCLYYLTLQSAEGTATKKFEIIK